MAAPRLTFDNDLTSHQICRRIIRQAAVFSDDCLQI